MKKLTSLFVILALLMLCACGSKTGATADGATARGAPELAGHPPAGGRCGDHRPVGCVICHVTVSAAAPVRGGIFAQTANKFLVNNPRRKQETCL